MLNLKTIEQNFFFALLILCLFVCFGACKKKDELSLEGNWDYQSSTLEFFDENGEFQNKTSFSDMEFIGRLRFESDSIWINPLSSSSIDRVNEENQSFLEDRNKMSDQTLKLKVTKNILQGVIFEWDAIRKVNDERFEVIVTFNGGDYRVVDSITVSGNIGDQVRYKAIDRCPRLDVNFYKIRQVLKNGEQITSPTYTVFAHTFKTPIIRSNGRSFIPQITTSDYLFKDVEVIRQSNSLVLKSKVSPAEFFQKGKRVLGCAIGTWNFSPRVAE